MLGSFLVLALMSMCLVTGTPVDRVACDIPNKNARFDCHPDPNPTVDRCTNRGCCWQPGRGVGLNAIDVPYCFFPQDYISYNISILKETDYGYQAVLVLTRSSGWPNDVRTLTLDVWFETTQRLHFKIYDSATSRYEVPIETPTVPRTKATAPDYDIKFTTSPFGISIYRKSTGAVLFNTALPGAPLIFADQFIQLSTAADTGLIYGLGEHRTRLLHNATSSWQQLIMWARDQPPAVNNNLYGTHPFYLGLEKDGNAHGVFFLNSNAMEVDLQPLPAVTFRTIGGVIDMYVFTGPSQESVVQQFTEVVGRPHMPPYWSLGFQLCRYNYNSVEKLKTVIARNRKLGIPYDVQWSDIDYMDRHLDWTYDGTGSYPGLPSVVDDLHNHTQKYVIIVDPGISNMFPGKYGPFDSGLEEGVFIRNASGSPLVGLVWPGTTVYPDFTHPQSADWWYKCAQDFHDMLQFDGLWIDMNEPSNFVDGSLFGCTSNNLDRPPFTPNIAGGTLHGNTVCPSAIQYGSTHYNLHNLYGLTEAIATNRALHKILGKRSLVISRSSYSSQGRYGGHWTGDILSSWDDLSYSVPAILEFQMYGIPLVGADVCGFHLDTTEELCTRWMQLGAFYPFFRNHNDDTSVDQDPAVFSLSARQAMKSVVLLRYTLLPFMYTQFYYSHVTGSPVIQPLFFEYPQDQQTYNIDTQFLWGASLLITPVLQKAQVTVNGYFPADLWYDIYDGHLAINSTGQWMTLKAPLDMINVHIRGGKIVTLQQPAVTTTLARKNPFGLLVAFNSSLLASGSVYWDDGESLDSVEIGQFNLIQFEASQGKIISNVLHSGYRSASGMILDTIRILGVSRQPQAATVNHQSATVHYHAETKELLIESFTVDLLDSLEVCWQ